MESKSFKHPEVNLQAISRNEGNVNMDPVLQRNMGQQTNALKKEENTDPVDLPPNGDIATDKIAGLVEALTESANNTATMESAGNSKTIYDPEIVQRMKKIIANYTENREELESITSETNINFIERLNIDSVDVVEIIIDTEQDFGITIEDEEIKQLKTFELLYKLVESKILASKEAGA